MPKKRQYAEDLVSAMGLLMRRIRSVRAAHEFSWTELLVMGRLARDGAATIADLARAESVKPQSMGSIVATLEKLGIVQRKPHLTDGRQVLVELTKKGIAQRDSDITARCAWLEQGIAQLDRDERETLYAASKIITRLVGS